MIQRTAKLKDDAALDVEAAPDVVAAGWSSAEGREVFRDDAGNVRGEVLLPDTSTPFHRVNFTDGVQGHPANSLDTAKALVERHVAGM